MDALQRDMGTAGPIDGKESHEPACDIRVARSEIIEGLTGGLLGAAF